MKSELSYLWMVSHHVNGLVASHPLTHRSYLRTEATLILVDYVCFPFVRLRIAGVLFFDKLIYTLLDMND